MTSRSDPPLALSRLRARGQLAELRAAELRFTPAEAAALLQQGPAGPGRILSDRAVTALAARTEGWAAGLQLAALSLRGQPDAAGFVAAFTGSHRYVLDFLAEEVLEQQSDQVRTFLLETSALERLSGDLCDAVTGRTGSQSLLEQVERAGLFLVPLDEVRGWSATPATARRHCRARAPASRWSGPPAPPPASGGGGAAAAVTARRFAKQAAGQQREPASSDAARGNSARVGRDPRMITLRDDLPDRLDDRRLPGRDSEFRSGNQGSAAPMTVRIGSRTFWFFLMVFDLAGRSLHRVPAV